MRLVTKTTIQNFNVKTNVINNVVTGQAPIPIPAFLSQLCDSLAMKMSADRGGVYVARTETFDQCPSFDCM
ncbi:unnamed protein product [Adineta ricciae]|uniref:Uncharacterized protein n=1 Tax=Adineta ricciae TaxID=249248 RepID=A0A814V456_ADIRI|nr:unnamed protein product [Adineta ricciae]CAF1183904.1 unnamed protein product [Adineta ricciae]